MCIRDRSKKKLRKTIGRALGAVLSIFLALISMGMTVVDSFLGTDVYKRQDEDAVRLTEKTIFN